MGRLKPLGKLGSRLAGQSFGEKLRETTTAINTTDKKVITIILYCKFDFVAAGRTSLWVSADNVG
jgi:hypothetical protein